MTVQPSSSCQWWKPGCPLLPTPWMGQYSILTWGIGVAEAGTKMPAFPKEGAGKEEDVGEAVMLSINQF